MDKQFTEALNAAYDRLKTEGAAGALTSVKAFFDENRDSIKAHFDGKSLQETESELRHRMEEAQKHIATVCSEKAGEAETFVKHLKSLLEEKLENHKREKGGVAA